MGKEYEAIYDFPDKKTPPFIAEKQRARHLLFFVLVIAR